MADEPWLPGSFTKNFSWGKGRGFEALHEHIRVGFDGTLQPVKRDLYRERVAQIRRPELVALNFFLFNQIIDGENYVIVDELVFQALTAEHSERFDMLALFALHWSMVGLWKGATKGQRYPALWAQNYITNHVAKDLDWDSSKITANDIEEYLRNNRKFVASTSYYKVSRNLNYIYEIGDVERLQTPRIERWWVDALFLAVDRIIADAAVDGRELPASALPERLLRSGFAKLTGPSTPEKSFAMAHLLSLYSVCGTTHRFDPAAVAERILVRIPNYAAGIANDDRPPGALHPTNPRILKTIPRNCAPLAESVGFQIIYPDDLEAFDAEDFIRTRSKRVTDGIKESGLLPNLTAEELHKLTRGE
jgi:hypothetical protein